jgi:hypothetical protein
LSPTRRWVAIAPPIQLVARITPSNDVAGISVRTAMVGSTAEPLPVVAERKQSLAAGGEEPVEDESLVPHRQPGEQVVGHGEDDVEVVGGISRVMRPSLHRTWLAARR